eukprot:TRINITY_DN24570_c0_g1_i1.p1 TRINITY_DN24570_c0_g1~~TRINITY_DN24570_c0_g1_i1.p1  ORF type:complete len:547 (+),score=99.92 TRINITY_DN24570_c0_g1_i1:199-1839(+)
MALYKVVVEDDKGRVVHASKTLDAGTLVMEAEPVASVAGREALKSLCLFCHAPLGVQAVKCQRPRGCQSSFCNAACQERNRALHSKECPALGRLEHLTGAEGPAEDEVRLLLRFLAAKRLGFQKSWPRFETNRRHLEWKYRSQLNDWYQEAANLQERLVQLPEFADVDIEEVLEAQLALFTNAMQMDVPGHSERLWALVPEISLLEHSCIPNAFITARWEERSRRSQLVQQVRLLMKVQTGEAINISYIKLPLPVFRRQSMLRVKGFCCKCIVCQTGERGVGGLRCMLNADCPGFLLPSEEFGMQRQPPAWRCCTCVASEDFERVLHMDQALSAKVDGISRLGDETKLLSLEKELTTQLHPNHYLLYRVRLGLVQTVGRRLLSSELDCITNKSVEEALGLVACCLSCVVKVAMLPRSHPEISGLLKWRGQFLLLKSDFQEAADALHAAATSLCISHGKESSQALNLQRTISRLERAYRVKARERHDILPQSEPRVLREGRGIIAWPVPQISWLNDKIVVSLKLTAPNVELEVAAGQLRLHSNSTAI